MDYLIDTHAHLNDPKFAGDLPEVIARAEAGGVGKIVVCGYDLATSRSAVELARRFECVYATVGVHPHDAKSFDDKTLHVLAELSAQSKVLAIGEIGLDFHYDFSPRQEQYAAFRAQIDLAGSLSLPIVVHSRESNPEAMAILREHSQNILRCVFHYFSGDEDFAREALDMGFYIGVDGPVTYKASEKLRRVVAMCPD
ncbi:MAG: TatD family hydrolase, partial [Armatimonadetes bacterium]|nr:TatD family hydrolase [Armatimonadota bacterium]